MAAGEMKVKVEVGAAKDLEGRLNILEAKLDLLARTLGGSDEWKKEWNALETARPARLRTFPRGGR